MFDIAPSEFLLVAFVALVVIGPKDLPKAMRIVGLWVGKARGVARQFRSGFDEMVRESELAEMEKKWAEENARIMREHPAQPTPVIDAEPVIAPVAGPAVAAEQPVDLRKDSDDDAPRPVMVEKPVVVPMDAGDAATHDPDRTADRGDDTAKAPS